MVKRIIEIFLGAIIAVSLFASYADNANDSQLILWYVVTPNVLKIAAWLFLFFLAGRLLFGKFRDYSAFFLQGIRKKDK